jgi:putative transposase
LVVSFVYVLACRLFALVLLIARGERSKELEILVLRHELSILRRQVSRPQFAPRDRLLLAALGRVLPRRSWGAFPVTPETLLRWHRRIVARRWTYAHRRPGRPPVERELRELILRLARENASWGYVRIVGELRKLGIDVSATLVRNVLARAGVPPAPQRDRLSWRSFLHQHAASTLACDFFTVETVWLRRLYVLVFLSLATRRVEYVACTGNPDTAWMIQQARNLLMDLGDRGRGPRFLIHDRDKKLSRAFDGIFESEGITIIRTPIRAPNATPTPSAGLAAHAASALTGSSSSAAASLTTSSACTSATTTRAGRTAHSASKRPTRSRHRRREAIRSHQRQPCDDATCSQGSSTI